MPNLKKIKTATFRLCIAGGVSILCFACGGGNTPLDADTRAAIDSATTAQINLARVHLDSVCSTEERTQMAHLVDSIKQVRLKEIAEQLKRVPR